jgi:response regulator RpfG family c-di-GMP phosphodiesterase
MIETIREALRNLEGHRVLFRHLDVLASLAAVMRSKDPQASHHLRDVSTIADLFLAHLPIAEQQRWEIHVACMLRDIGKFAISEAVLQKSGYLTREEFATVRQHPVISAQIISPLKGLDGLIPYVRHHHERWDGKGYPDGLRGEEIPYGARVVGLIDAFHAMVRSRPYAGRSRGFRYAREEIRRNAGSQFDPDLAARFLEVVDANEDILSTLVSRIETDGMVDQEKEEDAGGDPDQLGDD